TPREAVERGKRARAVPRRCVPHPWDNRAADGRLRAIWCDIREDVLSSPCGTWAGPGIWRHARRSPMNFREVTWPGTLCALLTCGVVASVLATSPAEGGPKKSAKPAAKASSSAAPIVPAFKGKPGDPSDGSYKQEAGGPSCNARI